MKHVATVILVIVGLINIAPLAGVSSAASLENLYGVELVNVDMIILLRHRAILFGMLGAFILYAAFKPHLQLAACLAALVSMVSFIVLVYLQGDGGDAVQKIVRVDLFASTLVVILLLLRLLRRAPADH